MHRDQQQRHIEQQTACTDEKVLAPYEEIELLREQVEYLSELVESQNEYLRYQQQQLEEIKQELKATNEDLCDALMLDASCPKGNLRLEFLEHLTLLEAKEVAKIILTHEKLNSKSIAELLTLIYDEKITAEELQQTDGLSLQINFLNKDEIYHERVTNSKKLKASAKNFRQTYKELGCQFVSFSAILMKFEEYWAEFKTIKEERKLLKGNRKQKTGNRKSP